MKVGVVMPQNREGHVRGGHVQMVQTIKGLERLGVDVIVSNIVSELPADVEICHIVGIQDSEFALTAVREAKRRGLKVVISTIWWDFGKFMLEEGWLSTVDKGTSKWASIACFNASLGKLLFVTWYRTRMFRENRRRKIACRFADMILPNSPNEAVQVNRLAGTNIPYVAVRNGIDEQLFDITDYNVKRDIPCLFVGIVDRTKNVHRLIQAITEIEVPLLIVGQSPDPAYRAYCESLDVKQLVCWKGQLTHEELVSHYNRTRVIALSSMRETPGLAVLEGAACGANVVVTEIGSAKEYFGDYVEYCNPMSIEDIAVAIRRALARPCPNAKLSQYVRSKFTWSLAAADTLEGYRLVSTGADDTAVETGAFKHAAYE